MNEYRPITMGEAENLTDEIETIVEGWFSDEPLNREEFIDRLESFTMTRGLYFDGGWDSPIIKKVLATARKIKKEIG